MALMNGTISRIATSTFIAATATGCAMSSTFVDYVETDTYVSSSDLSNHSELPYLKISKTPSEESRALLKLPTGKHDLDLNLEDALKTPGALPFAPFLILAEIFAQFFDCTSRTLAPQLLQSAKLVFDVTGNAGPANLSNQVSLRLVSKPWWQDASWERAHGFSQAGRWSQGGGDVDASFSPIAAAHVTNGASGSTLEFDIKDYFKSLLQSEQAHYGLELIAAGTLSGEVTLSSTQHSMLSQRPRLVTQYNCITPTGNLREPGEIRPFTYVLGRSGRTQ